MAARGVWLSIVALSAGCMLQQSSGGLAAGGSGTGGGEGDDGGAPDASEEAPIDTDDGQPPDAGSDAVMDVEVDSGGPGDDGGHRDGGGGGADSAGLHCSALPFGCICSPTEPGQVGACNTGSVIAMPGQQGVCCNNPYNCICVAYECVRMNDSTCTCGLAAAAAAGTRVDDCGTVSAKPGVTCCSSYGQCVCSTLDCLPIETKVSGCAVKDLLTCDVGDDTVPACEQAGMAGQPGG